jgi:hypothetical protein
MRGVLAIGEQLASSYIVRCMWEIAVIRSAGYPLISNSD